jgi:hypothetical protein
MTWLLFRRIVLHPLDETGELGGVAERREPGIAPEVPVAIAEREVLLLVTECLELAYKRLEAFNVCDDFPRAPVLRVGAHH